MAVNLVLPLVDGILENDEWGKVPMCAPSRGCPSRGGRKGRGGLEGRERNGRHHKFRCASWNRPGRTDSERTGSRTTRHEVCE